MSQQNREWLSGCVCFTIMLALLYGNGSLGDYDPFTMLVALGVVDVVVCILMWFYFHQRKASPGGVRKFM